MRSNRLTLIVAALASCSLSGGVFAADHREAPLIQEDPSADIADVYAFLNPNDNTKLVLAMTVNPFSVPAEAVTFHFSPNVRYRFNIDNDGDAQADRSVTVTFSERATQPQTLVTKFPGGVTVAGNVTQPTEEPIPNPPVINEGPNGIRVFAGPRDDPFFFDVVGFFRFLSGTGGFTGSDGFAGFNVSAIVVELPLCMVTNEGSGDDGIALQIWGDTSRRSITLRRSSFGKLERHFGSWQRIERMGNPAVATALIPAGQKDLFNIGKPKNDADDFAASIVASLQALGTDDANIGILASVAVPDTIKLDPAQAIGFPNGRAPADDVIDTLLFFIFNQTPVSDGVDANDRVFGNMFPYLADPWQPD